MNKILRLLRAQNDRVFYITFLFRKNLNFSFVLKQKKQKFKTGI